MTQHRTVRDFSETVTKLDNQGASSSSTTTTTVDHGTGRVSDWERLVYAYQENIGGFDRKAQWLIQKYSEFMELDVIEHAIMETGWAPRPSKQYLNAILRRYYMEGVKTFDDVMRDEDKHEQLKASDIRIRDSRWYDDGTRLTDFDWEREIMRRI